MLILHFGWALDVCASFGDVVSMLVVVVGAGRFVKVGLGEVGEPFVTVGRLPGPGAHPAAWVSQDRVFQSAFYIVS